MVLSAQAQRTWKVVTLVVTGATAFHCVLRTDYGPDRHVFTDLQAWYRDTVDRMVGIDAGAVEEERRARRLRDQAQAQAQAQAHRVDEPRGTDPSRGSGR